MDTFCCNEVSLGLILNFFQIETCLQVRFISKQGNRFDDVLWKILCLKLEK
jgi:hypothetical protein